MFEVLLETGKGLYASQRLSPDSEAGLSASLGEELLAALGPCLAVITAPGADRPTNERPKWPRDLRDYFADFGERLELEPGDTFVVPTGSGVKGGIDCAFFVLSGTVVAESQGGGGHQFPAGSLLHTDCFLQGAEPTSTLSAATRQYVPPHSSSESPRTATSLKKGVSSTDKPPARRQSVHVSDASYESRRTPAANERQQPAERSGPVQTRDGSFLTGDFLHADRSRAAADANFAAETASFSFPGRLASVDARGARPPRATDQTSSSSSHKPPPPCVVARLEFPHVLSLAASEPQRTSRFFVALAAALSELLALRSTELRSAVRSIGSQAGNAPRAPAAPRPAQALCRAARAA
jgi:hypothetical protein